MSTKFKSLEVNFVDCRILGVLIKMSGVLMINKIRVYPSTTLHGEYDYTHKQIIRLR